MFGNCAIGKSAIVIAPTMTVRIAITIATMGRRMKKLAILAPLRFFVRCWIHNFAISCFLCAGGNDSFSRFQAGCDYPKRANSRPDLNHTELRAVVGADHSYLIGSL